MDYLNENKDNQTASMVTPSYAMKPESQGSREGSPVSTPVMEPSPDHKRIETTFSSASSAGIAKLL